MICLTMKKTYFQVPIVPTHGVSSVIKSLTYNHSLIINPPITEENQNACKVHK